MAPYRLSFTTGGLLASEIAIACGEMIRSSDLASIRRALEAHRAFTGRTDAAVRRLTREVMQRAGELREAEVRLFVEGAPADRANLAWVAATRRYDVIATFARGVLREKFLGMQFELSYDDFDRFWMGEAQWHPELAATAESTRRKLRQNLFRMMHEAGFVSSQNDIQAATLSREFVRAWNPRHPSDFDIFPIYTSTAQELISA